MTDEVVKDVWYELRPGLARSLVRFESFEELQENRTQQGVALSAQELFQVVRQYLDQGA